jgi:hypothetical protein
MSSDNSQTLQLVWGHRDCQQNHQPRDADGAGGADATKSLSQRVRNAWLKKAILLDQTILGDGIQSSMFVSREVH